jgi:hypothetical protein
MNGELVRISKEVVVACFEVLTQYSPGEREEEDGSHQADRNSKQVSPGYKFRALHQLPRRVAELLIPCISFHIIAAV